MKKINNGYCDYYYIEDDGRVYDSIKNSYLTQDKKHRYRLKTTDGIYKKVSIKTLYYLVYKKPFCIDNIENLTDEVWKEIEGTNGNYYISNMGRIKSYKGYFALLMKPYKTSNGYERVDILINNIRRSKLVHRLTASAFLPPPINEDMVLHHKDFNKRNNNYKNLEWLTYKQHREKHTAKENSNA